MVIFGPGRCFRPSCGMHLLTCIRALGLLRLQEMAQILEGIRGGEHGSAVCSLEWASMCIESGEEQRAYGSKEVPMERPR